jgi:hypothetical protein
MINWILVMVVLISGCTSTTNERNCYNQYVSVDQVALSQYVNVPSDAKITEYMMEYKDLLED